MCMHTGIFVLTYRLGYGCDTNRATGVAINTDGQKEVVTHWYMPVSTTSAL